MRSIAILTIVFVTSVFVHYSAAQSAPSGGGLLEYIRENYTKQELMVPMRDGVKLYTAVYTPKDSGQKYPILLNRTPYQAFPYGKDQFPFSLGPNGEFAREGYIFVYQDVRGAWMSEGEFQNIRPEIASGPSATDESTDAYDTIDWLVKNIPNNNGRVGVYGISYPGFYASAAAINSHPALKACSPQAPVSDWFHGDDLHHNGALFIGQNYEFFATFGQDRPRPTSDDSYQKQWKGTRTDDGFNFFLPMGLKEAADYYVTAVGQRIPFWDEMMSHPNYDQYWKDRNILPKLKNVKCATMTVGGWFDNEDLYGALNTYSHIESQNPGINNILVMGPWSHGGWERSTGEWLGTAYFGQANSPYYQQNMELPFFNFYLKGKGDVKNLKEVNAFDTGANTWNSLDAWPPKQGVKQERIYLQPNGKLSFTAPRTSGSDEYVSDPMHPVPYTEKITNFYPVEFMTEDQRFAASRPDVLTYQSDPLDHDVTIAGNIDPDLWFASSGTDSDVVVKLIDVFPDDYHFPQIGTSPYGEPLYKQPPAESTSCVFASGGYQMLLRGEPFPARFRNSFEAPAPLKPNSPAEIRYEMPGIMHTFKKGHRIMVQIQSTWFPLVARNPQRFVPNYEQAGAASFQKATERVYYGGRNASSVVLPVLNK